MVALKLISRDVRRTPLGDDAVAVHDDATRARAVEQRTHDVVDALIGEDRAEVAAHVARARALPCGRAGDRGGERVVVDPAGLGGTRRDPTTPGPSVLRSGLRVGGRAPDSLDAVADTITNPTFAPTIAPSEAPTDTPEESPSRPVTDDGDHDRFAHFARKDDVTRAYVTGEAIVALCGKKWVPTRDPKGYPICPTCKERKDAGWSL